MVTPNRNKYNFLKHGKSILTEKYDGFKHCSYGRRQKNLIDGGIVMSHMFSNPLNQFSVTCARNNCTEKTHVLFTQSTQQTIKYPYNGYQCATVKHGTPTTFNDILDGKHNLSQQCNHFLLFPCSYKFYSLI